MIFICCHGHVEAPRCAIILKILEHGSIRGLSILSFELELVGYTIALAYCLHGGLPFSAYGELAFLLIQDRSFQTRSLRTLFIICWPYWTRCCCMQFYSIRKSGYGNPKGSNTVAFFAFFFFTALILVAIMYYYSQPVSIKRWMTALLYPSLLRKRRIRFLFFFNVEIK
ncbi:putative mannose-P-dolichol utilization defect 1 protein [Rosa chinensis]|uniref:Putative mannose-P-dolichol utilization defect 1 protein n=1 Tax=Rosa chinensis TaxID=74649 RepID=A0A2P6SHR1_ROSCH|nr:putative mannose-P-dolichol utilization defect 1 protein [Rosa chinensis]